MIDGEDGAVAGGDCGLPAVVQVAMVIGIVEELAKMKTSSLGCNG